MKNTKKKKEMNLRDLLISKVSVLYDVESVMIKSLPKLAKASADSELKKGFTNHLAETKNQAKRLEKIFSVSSNSTSRPGCPAPARLKKPVWSLTRAACCMLWVTMTIV